MYITTKHITIIKNWNLFALLFIDMKFLAMPYNNLALHQHLFSTTSE